MSEYHDEAWLEDHVVRDVCVVHGHDGHSLLAWYPPAHILLVLPPVHLPGLQGEQACRPLTLVSVLH